MPPPVLVLVFAETDLVSGHHSPQVYAREFEPDFHANHPQYKYKDCDNVPSLSISDVQKCWYG